EGELCHLINADGSTWIIDGDKLEITLSKSESGIIWAELVKGDTRGEELVDPAMIEEMHNRLAQLTSAVGGPDEKPPYNA
ncbi:CS domain-containing protein, partial [Staphylococcus aureus]|uniref:CS domain-containing protein n=1 Tax=Staphylococcus aureus TaxID=1280 RepID=UPI0038B3859C